MQLKHEDAILYCDSALLFEKENRLIANGNVRISQPGKLSARSRKMEYDGNERRAILSGMVTMSHREMSLRTERLDYDLKSKIGYYSSGADIRSGSTNLKSRKGSYHSESGSFFFRDSVEVIDPEFRLKADTLKYNDLSKKAYFFGPTYINTRQSRIHCVRGSFDTRKRISNLHSRARLINDRNQLLEADSLYYDEGTGEGSASGNIYFADTAEQIVLKSESALIDRESRMLKSFGEPLLINYAEEDTFFLSADTLKRQRQDSTDYLFAFNQVLAKRGSMSLSCDSMVYNRTDSFFVFFEKPLMWIDSFQLEADSMRLYMKNCKFDSLALRDDAFLSSRHDMLKYDQTSGYDMDILFAENRVSQIRVQGGGKSIFYIKNEKEKFTGLNQVESKDILFEFEEGELIGIRYYEKPSGDYLPIRMVMDDYPELDGFFWWGEIKANTLGKLKTLLEKPQDSWAETEGYLEGLAKW